MTDVKKKRLRIVCIVLAATVIAALGILEYVKPTYSTDPILNEVISMLISRACGGLVFVVLVIYLGFRVINPIRKPFWKPFWVIFPAFLVVINNFPWIGLLTGNCAVIYGGGAIVLFAAECFAIGLFEEFAFRGVVLLMLMEKRRQTRKDVFISVMLSGVVFGGIHLVNLFVGASPAAVIRQIGYSFLIGSMCAVVLLKTANIWICVLLHALFDFGGGLIDTLGAGTIWDPATIAITVVLSVAVTAYLTAVFFRMEPREWDRLYPTKAKKEPVEPAGD